MAIKGMDKSVTTMAKIIINLLFVIVFLFNQNKQLKGYQQYSGSTETKYFETQSKWEYFAFQNILSKSYSYLFQMNGVSLTKGD